MLYLIVLIGGRFYWGLCQDVICECLFWELCLSVSVFVWAQTDLLFSLAGGILQLLVILLDGASARTGGRVNSIKYVNL